MKKEAFVILFILVLTSLTSLTYAVEYTYSTSNFLPNSVFTITSLRYDPYPIAPGEKFEIWMKVEPKGTTSVENATCKVNLVYPFSSYENSVVRNFGKLSPGDSVVLNFKLKVDQNVAVGNNALEIWCTEDPTKQAWTITKVNISVESRYPTLNLQEIKTIPDLISPGEESQLILVLKNSADSSMKDISLKLDLSSVEISSFGEVAEKSLKYIEAGKSSEIIFKIKALPGIKGGLYKIPFSLKYTNNLGNSFNQSGFIGIEVSSKPQLLISVDSTSISKTNSLGNIEIKIVNSGLTDIKYLSVKLNSGDYKIISSDLFYIGNIDSDDFGTANFKISARTLLKNHINLLLEINFRDSVNNERVEKVDLSMDLLSDKELGKSPNYFTNFIYLIVLLFLILLFVKPLRIRIFGFLSSLKDKYI